MVKKLLVLNTSSSIYFTKMGLFNHLLKKFNLITSKEIEQEIKSGEDIGYKDARLIYGYVKDNNIKICNTKNTKKIVKNFGIKETDASIISLAQEKGCFLATEDKQIEKICLLTETKIVNTAVLIYFFWTEKIFSDEQSFLLLDLLIKNGYNKETCLKIKEKIIKGDKNE